MAYSSYLDVVNRYTPIITMVGTNANDVATTDITSKFIPDAQGIVDAYIGAKYTTPLADPVPQIITQITSDLAIFNLTAEKLPRQPDFMQGRFDRAIKMLEQLRDGKMVLGSSVSVVTSGDQEAWSPTKDYHPVFSPVLRDVDQKADVDQILAERDEREDDVIGG